jgi:ABC-type amino acid transport substrate-binding protein
MQFWMKFLQQNRIPMKRYSILLIIISLLILPLVGCRSTESGTSKDKTNNSVYGRVIDKGVIRAAYTIYPPGCMKDSSGKLVGVFVESLEEAAKLLDLKLEWTEEVGWATQIEGLQTNRYDMIGSSVWANPKRAKLSTLSIPLYYSPIHVYTRLQETKYDDIHDWTLLNSTSVRIATIDGGTGEQIAKSQFPLAQRIALPQLTDFGQSFMDVVHNKADVVFMEPFHASKFSENNPNTIKCLSEGRPLRTFGNCFMFGRNEVEFANMLNTVLQDLLNSGFIDDLLAKYEKYPNAYYKVIRPYSLD